MNEFTIHYFLGNTEVLFSKLAAYKRIIAKDEFVFGFEKELLGFYVTGHPLTKFAEILRRYELASTAQLAQLPDGQAIRLGGLIGKLQPKLTKQNKPMAILSIRIASLCLY